MVYKGIRVVGAQIGLGNVTCGIYRMDAMVFDGIDGVLPSE